MRLVDLARQVQSILPVRFGGTGNAEGYARATVVPMANRSGGAMPIGSVVTYSASSHGAVLSDAADASILGVVVGSFGTNGVLSKAAVAAGEVAAVCVRGVVRVLIDANVTGGEYAYVSATDGLASGDPVRDVGAWGRFVQDGNQSTRPLTLVDVWGVTDGASGGPTAGGGVNVVFYAPTNGNQVDIEVPYDLTLTSAAMLADASGDAVVDLWVDTYANYPPTNADSITGGNEPTISSGTKDVDASLSGWTVDLDGGDVMRLNVDSVSGITRLTVSLRWDRR